MTKLAVLVAITLYFALCLSAPARAEDAAKTDAPDGAVAKTSEQRRLEREEERRKKREEAYNARLEEKKKKNEKPAEEVKPSDQQVDFAEAQELLKSGDLSRAYDSFARLADQKDDDIVARKAAEQAKKVLAMGEDEVKKILAMDDPAEAQKKLHSIYATWWRTPVKDAMSDARKQLRMKAAQLAAKGGKAAPPAEGGGPAAGAAPGNDANAAAADAAAADEGAPKQKFTPDQMAQMWLIIGDLHRLNGRIGKAKESYTTVIYDYPESKFAQDARYRLEELQIEEKADSSGGDQ